MCPSLRPSDLDAIAQTLLAAYDTAGTLQPISTSIPEFGSDDAYAVLERIATHRREHDWHPVGAKIGFTNRRIWARYGVDRPMWAHVWAQTVTHAEGGRARVPVGSFVQPRVEPEVVFGLRGSVPVTDDPVAVLASVEWMAAGFEIVQCPFPDWRFGIADCTAAFGLHGGLVVGTRVPIDERDRAVVAELLPTFEVTLSRNGDVVDRGAGANVLDSPALALAHLARVLAGQPQFSPPAGGSLVTTGTLTDARPIVAGETWTSDYGSLGLDGITLTLG